MLIFGLLCSIFFHRPLYYLVGLGLLYVAGDVRLTPYYVAGYLFVDLLLWFRGFFQRGS